MQLFNPLSCKTSLQFKFLIQADEKVMEIPFPKIEKYIALTYKKFFHFNVMNKLLQIHSVYQWFSTYKTIKQDEYGNPCVVQHYVFEKSDRDPIHVRYTPFKIIAVRIRGKIFNQDKVFSNQ
jgi:hypothetical protein